MTTHGVMRLTVNGTERRVPDAWRDETLLSTLRNLGLIGAKYSCGIGLCGACKVQVDGVPLNSCTVRTGDVEGHSILTIEGLAQAAGARFRRLGSTASMRRVVIGRLVAVQRHISSGRSSPALRSSLPMCECRICCSDARSDRQPEAPDS